MDHRPAKRARTEAPEQAAGSSPSNPGVIPWSLSRPISPPRRRRQPSPPKVAISDDAELNANQRSTEAEEESEPSTILPSPWQLTKIRDLPNHLNQDAFSLQDVLGDPLITDVWNFNFMHDIPFIMGSFDEDTRALVKLHIVHGFWKREDPSKIRLEEQAREYANVTLHTAPMPGMFGTHHSKMLILFRIDDTAQVVIHTANMIPHDWTNMTNGVWRSPLLPKLVEVSENAPRPGSETAEVGSGARFKKDLLAYLGAYNARGPVTRVLIGRLQEHDFSSVRAALLASVPGSHSKNEAPWGWSALRRTLGSVPCSDGEAGVVAVQVSSIATLGPKDTWLQQAMFESMRQSRQGATRPAFKVVFPTADEIRRSLDGYASGNSIHTKIQSPQQVKQLEYLRPYLCHWANDSEKGAVVSEPVQSGGRERAAPHIKTYIRYGKDYDGSSVIDWALLTSANLSKQAWGEAGAGSHMKIASWEIGVLVWPELLAGSSSARMVGSFGQDRPKEDAATNCPVIGLRIPYSLPLQQYGRQETPWVWAAEHTEPDRHGRLWAV